MSTNNTYVLSTDTSNFKFFLLFLREDGNCLGAFYLYILFQNCVTDQEIWFKHYAMRDVGMKRQVVGSSTI